MSRLFTSIRGQLVLWYLGILCFLLVALGVFQWLTVNGYLRNAAQDGIRHAATRELSVLGPCYIQSGEDLRSSAQLLAKLLGGYDTGDMIVTTKGETLASHDLGPPGAGHPIHLTSATIQTLIGGSVGDRSASPDACSSSRPVSSANQGYTSSSPQSRSVITSNDLLVVAVPIGPPGHPVGYAILARSLAAANNTARRVVVVFAIGAGVVLVLTALVALPIINHALRPLNRVARTAEAIAAGHTEQRANLTHSRDEVGRMGEAFDAMVDQLQTAMTAMTASEERMRRFLADASHELRTPVTVLRGSSQVLLRHAEPMSPDTRRALSDLHEEAVRLARLVDDLLTLSRLDAGRVPAPETVALRPFLQDFLGHYSSAWADRSVQIEPGIDGLAASVNPDSLQRILTNLIDNAARYSRPGGEIRLAAAADGSAVTLSVSDDGPGMNADDARRVFDRFYRANPSRSRGSGGSGLGLSIVRSLVEQSGGSIDLDTAPERGTTVTVRLPKAA